MNNSGGLSLIDRAIFLSRTSFFPHLWIYYCATAPCLLYFLWFFNDMSAGTGGRNRVVCSALILTVLVILMKTGQALFCLRSFETMMGNGFSKLTLSKLATAMGFQVMLAFAELIVLPIALLLTIPFGWCYAFFQIGSMGTLLFENNVFANSIIHAKLRPKQNHTMLWVICPVFLLAMVILYIATPPLVSVFSIGTNGSAVVYIIAALLALCTLLVNPLGWLLFANFLTAIVVIPQFIRILSGWETIYSMNMTTIFHPAVILSTWALCFLFMDPLVKVCYIIRIYDHQSIRSGNDLLKKLSVYGVVIFAVMHLINPSESSAELSVTSQKMIDVKIEEVLKEDAYIWREKKTADLPELNINTGPLKSMALHVKDFFKKINQWIKKYFKQKEHRADKSLRKWKPVFYSNPLQIAVISSAVLIILFLIYRNRQRRWNKNPDNFTDKEISTPATVPVHLLSAEDNSSDEWEKLARDAAIRGDYTHAIRYFYLSSIRLLVDKKLLIMKKSRSNREIRRELLRRYPDQAMLHNNIALLINHFEYSWFGTLTATGHELEMVISAHTLVKELLRQYA